MKLDKKIASSIRAEGAEIYVQGYIMLELGFPTALASRNMPGYDVFVQNIENNKTCKIQVKYRSAINSDGFRFKNYDFDFAILVIGNIGKIAKEDDKKYKDTEFYILPVIELKKGISKENKGDDLFPLPNRKKHKDKYKIFKNSWSLISDLLNSEN